MDFSNSNCAPRCNRENCFAYADGRCRALSDNRFNRDCPFYKNADEKKVEDARCKERADKWKESRKKRLG